MNVVITGSNSFLGKILTNKFVKSGHRVYAVQRSENNISHSDSIIYVKADMSMYRNLSKYVPQADIFINLAWEGTGHNGRSLKDIQINNIRYSLDALESAKKIGCSVFIESGSQAEYGITSSLTNENSLCNPVSEYGKAKLALQQKAFEISKIFKISYIHLRIFSLVGEDDHPWTLVSSAIERFCSNQDLELTSCTQLWNFLYVNDAAEMIYNIAIRYLNLKYPSQEIFNIASSDTRVLKSFVEEIKKITKSTSRCLFGNKEQETIVNLNPEINKYLHNIGNINFTSFDSVIRKILKKHDKTI